MALTLKHPQTTARAHVLADSRVLSFGTVEVIMQKEVWKDIPGYEGRYQASSEGRVRSLTRKVRKHNGYRTVNGRVLKTGKTPNGYYTVALGSKNGKPNTCHVHKAVLMAFYGKPEPRLFCCHNNGNKTDNRISNLRWDTPHNNCLDAVKHGHVPRGESNGNSQLNPKSVRFIRRAYKHGCPRRGSIAIGRRLGVSSLSVMNVINSKTWRHV